LKGENIMQVFRKQEMEVSEVLVGDQIVVNLNGFLNIRRHEPGIPWSEFTATAQKVTDERILFMFDDCVAERQMNEEQTNKGGFDSSDLNKWIQSDLLEAFPENLRDRVRDLSIPTCGQIFGGNDLEWCRDKFEDDGDEQLELMKTRRNRIANFGDNDYTWYWLRNATKKDVSASAFALVYGSGLARYNAASSSYGVRPVFWLVR
jgi:hypothetical protein